MGLQDGNIHTRSRGRETRSEIEDRIHFLPGQALICLKIEASGEHGNSNRELGIGKA